MSIQNSKEFETFVQNINNIINDLNNKLDKLRNNMKFYINIRDMGIQNNLISQIYGSRITAFNTFDQHTNIILNDSQDIELLEKKISILKKILNHSNETNFKEYIENIKYEFNVLEDPINRFLSKKSINIIINIINTGIIGINNKENNFNKYKI